ncbi:MAG: thiol-disulfide oxidoreductase DCC family protein [Ignavibacteriota bacterium]
MAKLNNADPKIILFDGVCNFCNYWVNFIIDRDRQNVFKFAALQSEKGKELIEKFNLPKDDFDSFILISQNKVFKKSVAAFEILKHLNSWTKIIYPIKFLPIAVNDFFYDLIAKNRYKFFGRKDVCRIPTKDEIKRFL